MRSAAGANSLRACRADASLASRIATIIIRKPVSGAAVPTVADTTIMMRAGFRALIITMQHRPTTLPSAHVGLSVVDHLNGSGLVA